MISEPRSYVESECDICGAPRNYDHSGRAAAGYLCPLCLPWFGVSYLETRYAFARYKDDLKLAKRRQSLPSKSEVVRDVRIHCEREDRTDKHVANLLGISVRAVRKLRKDHGIKENVRFNRSTPPKMRKKKTPALIASGPFDE